jgi:hypothetical protein
MLILLVGIGASAIASSKSAADHGKALVARDAVKAIRRLVTLGDDMERLATKVGELDHDHASYIAEQLVSRRQVISDCLADWGDVAPEVIAAIERALAEQNAEAERLDQEYHDE